MSHEFKTALLGIQGFSELLRDTSALNMDDAKSPMRKLVGTDLRLGIARQVVQMHGGRFWVVRTPQSGSEYHFSVPALSVEHRMATDPHSTQPRT